MTPFPLPLQFEPHALYGSAIDGEPMPFGYISTAAPMPIFELSTPLKWPTDALASLSRQMAAAPQMHAALVAAESFLSGFEGDEVQEGIDALLASIRASISKAGGASDHPCPGAWQPIETAPQDGTPILARYMWLGEHRYLVIRRSQNGPWWLADHDGLIKHDDDKAKSGNYDFTHWSPITPPALDGGRVDG